MNEIVLVGAACFALAPVLAALAWMQRLGDRPKIQYAKVPPPRAYAAIRKVVTGIHFGECHYRVVMADPTRLHFLAVMEWRERQARELECLYSQGFKFNQMLLNVSVSLDSDSGSSKVETTYTSNALFLRGKAWFMQAQTERLIREELASLQATRSDTQFISR